MGHIKEYIASEDVLEFAQRFSSASSSHTNLQKSLQIAHELYETLKLPQLSMENKRQELMLEFHSELCCTQSLLSDYVCEFDLINKENLEKVAGIITVLKDEINELILTSNEILQEVMNKVNEFFTEYSTEHDKICEKREIIVMSDFSQDVKNNETDDNADLHTVSLPTLEQHTGELTNEPQQPKVVEKIEESEIIGKQMVAGDDLQTQKSIIAHEVYNYDGKINTICSAFIVVMVSFYKATLSYRNNVI